MCKSNKYECYDGGVFGEDFGRFGKCEDCMIAETCRKENERTNNLTSRYTPANSLQHSCCFEKTNELIIFDAYDGGRITVKQMHYCKGCGEHKWETVKRMPEFDFVEKVKKGEL